MSRVYLDANYLYVHLRQPRRALDRLQLELIGTDQRVVARTRQLLIDPGLAPRDAFHAAHAIEASCETIVSSDPDFDRVADLRRLGPPQATTRGRKG